MSDPIQTPPSAPDEPAPAHNEQHATPPVDKPELEPEHSEDAQKSLAAPAIDVKALTDHTLHFLATASNETLGACLVGLGASTYIVLGRVGLVLIGVVGGVALHATWEGHTQRDGAHKTVGHEQRKRELGVDVVRRVLDWRDTASQGKEKDQSDHTDTDVKLYAGKELDFSSFEPETAAALTELTDAVIRDYVKWWYSPILPNEPTFPDVTRQTLTAFLISVSSHVARKRPADIFVDFTARSSSFMIIFFQELSSALAASPGESAPEAVDLYLESNSNSALANILDTKYQEKQFYNAADDMLQSFLDAKTYNCKPAQVFLRQMLAKVVFEMILVSCSKPEWINGWIVYLLEDGEPEIMHAIDAGVDGASGQLEKENIAVETQGGASDAAASPEQKNHKRVVSKAQEAMDDAMREAQRLSEMIAEENARKLREHGNTTSPSPNDDRSETTTQGMATPTSSESETLADGDVRDLGISNISSQASSQLGPPSPTKSVEEPPKQEVKRPFTSFDQIIPRESPTALNANPPPLTLYNCKIAIFDDSAPGDKGLMKSKPMAEYLIQIEPASNHYSGWMTVRKYSDLETLHEVLRRIAPITGTTGFTEAHGDLPAWRGQTKASLRGELERYLNDAVRYKPLAESEGMKRFLEKESQMSKSPGSKGGFPGIGWPSQTFDTMGKGMIDVLTKAPKEVAGGGKAFFGGVTGVLGSVATPFGGARRNRESISNGSPVATRPVMTAAAAPTPTSTPPIQNRHGRAESTVSELPTHIRTESSISSFTRRTSTDSLRNPNSPIIDQQPQREAQMERRPSSNPDGDGKRSGRSSIYGGSRSNSRAPSARQSVDLSPAMGGDQILNLPPIPSDIPDDYAGFGGRTSLDPYHKSQPSARASTISLSFASTTDSVPPLPRRPSVTSLTNSIKQQQPKPAVTHAPLSEQETTVLIDLFFALTNELYTLSSAWTLRRTLLSAAKSFLLRPGNPQLASIQQLLSTILDTNSSSSTIASNIRKIRANGLPTEEELKAWPKEMTGEEKEELRIKARRLLCERGMPVALSSVMGAAAGAEALGRVFDVLQVERVGRGVVFGLLVQGLRGITQ